MDVGNFKQLFTANLQAMNINTLEHYLIEGEKLIANMKIIDPLIVEMVSKLHDELQARGK